MFPIDLASAEVGIKPLSTSHFSALQPLLSTQYSPVHVKSLLVLALLFWQKPTFSDTQIGDSPHLFREFIHPGRQSLTPLIKDCLINGEARLLLRNAFYAGPERKLLDCAELIDVYSGWRMQGMPAAWVVPNDAPNRDRYIDAWNKVTPRQFVLSYDYLEVKKSFQARARQIVLEVDLKQELGSERYLALCKVLDMPWFSHSHVYAVLNNNDEMSRKWAQRFGLVDEAAYAEYFNSGMAAINSSWFVSRGRTDEDEAAVEYINEIVSRQFKFVNVQGLELLHLLTYDDIVAIKKKGSFLPDLVKNLASRRDLSENDLTELSLSLSSYWKIICNEIDRLHPGGANVGTEIGLAVKRRSDLSLDEMYRGFSFVLSGLLSLLSGGHAAEVGVVRKVLDAVSFRWIFRVERTELKAMRKVLSRQAVLAAQTKG